MTDLPAPLLTGLVTGRFIAALIDGADSGAEPDVVPAAGKITLTPDVPYLPLAEAEGGAVTVIGGPVVVVLDAEGYLSTPHPDPAQPPMARGVRVLATDSPGAPVTGFTWKVDYSFAPINGRTPTIPSHAIAVPAGGQVDLTTAVKVPSSPGVGIPQVEDAARRAAESAAVAMGAAQEAATAAQAAAQAAATNPGGGFADADALIDAMRAKVETTLSDMGALTGTTTPTTIDLAPVNRVANAPVTATVTETIDGTWVIDTGTPVPVPRLMADGKISANLLPATATANDPGIAAYVQAETSETRTALTRQYGGRYTVTDPRFAGGAKGDGATDDYPAIAQAIQAANATGGIVFFPPGVYRVNQPLPVIPGGVRLEGVGTSYSAPEDGPIARAAVIRAGAPMSYVVRLGSDATSSAAGAAGAGIRSLIIDGRDLADTVVEADCRRWYIEDSQIYWGRLIGLNVPGQNGRLDRSIVSQNNKGSGVVIRHEPDNKIRHSQIRQAGADGACILIKPVGASNLGTGNLTIEGNHIWTGQNGVPTPGALIKADLNASKTLVGVQIVGNQLEGVLGDQIKISVADSARATGILVAGNTIFQNPAQPADTYSVLGFTGTGTVDDLIVGTNQFYTLSAGSRWRSIIHDYGTGPRNRVMLEGNEARRVSQPWTKAAGSTWQGPEPGLNIGIGADGAEWRTRHYGTATATGDGTTTVFTLASGLSFPTGRIINLTPTSPAAAAPHYAALTGGTLTVTHTTPPEAGAALSYTYDLWR